MWLNLNLEGIELSLRIDNYKKTDNANWDTTWCKVDFSVVSKDWLNYHMDHDEVLLACEVDDLRDEIKDLLDDHILEQTEIECMEPDFKFILNPKKDLRKDPKMSYICPGYEIEDIDMRWHISFWHEGLTENYLSICLLRKELECFYCYLQLISGRISLDNPEVGRLIKERIICEKQ